MTTRTWTIDATHRAPLRLVIREPLEDNKLDQSRWSFFKSMEPYARVNFLGSALYSIIERHGA
jgi:hypothetical protein